jgi:hypothetical protein
VLIAAADWPERYRPVIAGLSFRFEPENYSNIAAETAALISQHIGNRDIA